MDGVGDVTAQIMMVLLFLFFFSESTLGKIAEYTNAKATESVWKKKTQRSDGKFYYKVCRCRLCARYWMCFMVYGLLDVYCTYMHRYISTMYLDVLRRHTSKAGRS